MPGSLPLEPDLNKVGELRKWTSLWRTKETRPERGHTHIRQEDVVDIPFISIPKVPGDRSQSGASSSPAPEPLLRLVTVAPLIHAGTLEEDDIDLPHRSRSLSFGDHRGALRDDDPECGASRGDPRFRLQRTCLP